MQPSLFCCRVQIHLARAVGVGGSCPKCIRVGKHGEAGEGISEMERHSWHPQANQVDPRPPKATTGYNLPLPTASIREPKLAEEKSIIAMRASLTLRLQQPYRILYWRQIRGAHHR